jgi:hypothetical protein
MEPDKDLEAIDLEAIELAFDILKEKCVGREAQFVFMSLAKAIVIVGRIGNPNCSEREVVDKIWKFFKKSGNSLINSDALFLSRSH